MMQLSRISLVQWHLFGREDLDISGNGAILGQNTSGKSTLIDLIQAVMAGGSPRYYRFNRSAGETGSSRSERTMRGYCLGQLNEHHVLREQSITHIALVFDDPTGMRKPVSIGLCIEASATEDAQIVGRYIAPGVRIHTDMLVEDLADGQQRSAAWSLVRSRLEQTCAERGTTLLRPDGARNFIREYMRLLFTGRRHGDPERFIRAFITALSFEEMRSVEDFVRRFLLEKDDIDIGELRDSIQRYRDIQKDIHELERRLESLRNMQKLVGEYVVLLEREDIARGVESLAALIESGAVLIAKIRALREKTIALNHVGSESARLDDEQKMLREEEEVLQAQIAALDVTSQKSILTAELRLKEQARAAATSRLQQRFLSTARAVTLLDHHERLASLKLGHLFEMLETIRRKSGDQASPAWPQNPAEMEHLINAAKPEAAASQIKLLERRDDAITCRKNLEKELAELEDRLRQARSGQVALDPRTADLISTLQSQGMRPRALCQVTEILDESWRNAAEAFLARDREAIIVQPEHAARAVEILRSDSRDRFRGCRVVNTRRLASRSLEAQPGSLASIMKSDDALASAFIDFRAGKVRLAHGQPELMDGGRAIMKDGTYNNDMVVEVLHAQGGLKIGRAAAPLMREDLSRQTTEHRMLIANHVQNEKFHDDLARRLDAFIQPVEATNGLEALAFEINQLDESRSDLQQRLDRVASSIDPRLRAAVERIRLRLQNIQADKGACQTQQGELTARMDELSRMLGSGEYQLGSRRHFSLRRQVFRQKIRNRAQLSALRDTYIAERPKALASVITNMKKRAEDAKEEYHACEGEIREALTHYRLNFDNTAPSIGPASISIEIRNWIETNTAMLEANELIRYRQQADEAASQISRLLRTAFVQELNNRFNKLKSELDALARALKSRPFNRETYTLNARPKPELSGLYHLAQASQDDENVFETLFSHEAPRDPQHAQALADVERLLNDEALDFTLYQDYRNYYSFDLTTRNIETGLQTSYERRKGTASGAERQVPYYVIIGAALASIYHSSGRHSERTDFGLGLAVFDEAFSKMDGPNQRTLLGFYTDIGLQVVIAAPSEKRAIIYENMDSIADVFRHGNAATAETIRIKPHAQEQMRANNPQYISDAELAIQITANGPDAVAGVRNGADING
ncbi:DNA primase [Rhizobium grahamii]|uniref:DNA primase n=1 Tax=Rhizobium grahamii TaxID=1120045 RepID=A0A5Q0CC51_9HYPH|nr:MULTISPECIES: SbcC/MukB-like Walker B domain-containing protein [Rhizobium]QFY61477.1 DNA primase [Rhizobium grahamii]QRM49370.1 DNA primase [Rhizobium sp. BG6]